MHRQSDPVFVDRLHKFDKYLFRYIGGPWAENLCSDGKQQPRKQFAGGRATCMAVDSPSTDERDVLADLEQHDAHCGFDHYVEGSLHR